MWCDLAQILYSADSLRSIGLSMTLLAKVVKLHQPWSAVT